MKKLIYLFSILVLFACNKEKRFSKRLMKKEKWEVVDVTIDGTKSEFFGIWSVSPNVDIYDSVPSAIWNWNNQDAVANWQFQDKGKSFVLQYQQQCVECDGVDLDSLDYFTYNISGKYEVEKHGFNKMIFKSSSTYLYTGKEVVITFKRIK
jgi:hypothetical protein